jgi:hypothetical protein
MSSCLLLIKLDKHAMKMGSPPPPSLMVSKTWASWRKHADGMLDSSDDALLDHQMSARLLHDARLQSIEISAANIVTGFKLASSSHSRVLGRGQIKRTLMLARASRERVHHGRRVDVK